MLGSARLRRERLSTPKEEHVRRRLQTSALLLAMLSIQSQGLDIQCSTSPQSLLWSVTRENSSEQAYLLGTYPLSYKLAPLDSTVEQVLSCADVAFFQLPCSLSEGGGYDNFMEHCKSYPTSNPEDAIALRLPSEEQSRVRAAFLNMLDHAPPACSKIKAKLQSWLSQVGSTEFRMTLQTLYLKAIEMLDPLSCELEGSSESSAESLEDFMRARLANKPIWGLEDISLECGFYQGNTVEEDRRLGQRITAEFTSSSWLGNVSKQLQKMSEVMQCGNLDLLKEIATGSGLHLPKFDETMLNARNKVLAKGINTQIVDNPGRTTLFVVNVQHLMSVNKTGATIQGIPELLQASGYTVERVDGALNCKRSGLTGPGAVQTGRCLRPAMQIQPDSCRKFRSAFMARLGNDTEYGRHKDKSGCLPCVNSTDPCTCEVTWTNRTAFDDLCHNLEVDGVKGIVYDMDLTRNPYSHRLGQALAAKTVKSLFLFCFASTCNIPLAEEIGLRKWYAKDPSLSLGKVDFRAPGESAMSYYGSYTGIPGPFGVKWSPLTWVLALLAVIILIAMLVLCFRVPKRSSSINKPLRQHVYKNRVEEVEEDDEDSETSSYAEELKPFANEGVMPPSGRSDGPDMAWQQQLEMQQRDQMLRFQQMQEAQRQEYERQQWEMQQRFAQSSYQPVAQSPPMRTQPPTSTQQIPDGFDGSLLRQAMQMRSALGDAGAQAVASLHSFTGNPNPLGGSLGPGGLPSYGTQTPGSPVGGGLSPSASGYAAQTQSMMLQGPGALQMGSVSFNQTPSYYGQPPAQYPSSPTAMIQSQQFQRQGLH
mmetsp:Transcript_23694/g.51800  ORF Transcript_23694/g.51800 Transcript_23694/m.51800 type:complete len:818 (-) Transcript_23694:225-2678(-)